MRNRSNENLCPRYPRRQWKQMFTFKGNKFDMSYLALINRAGGLYGRILTEVASTERTQRGLYTRPRSRFSHTDRFSSVQLIRCLLYGKDKNNLIRLM